MDMFFVFSIVSLERFMIVPIGFSKACALGVQKNIEAIANIKLIARKLFFVQIFFSQIINFCLKTSLMRQSLSKIYKPPHQKINLEYFFIQLRIFNHFLRVYTRNILVWG